MKLYKAQIHYSATLEGHSLGKTFEIVEFVADSEAELIDQLTGHYGEDFRHFEQMEGGSHIATLTKAPTNKGGVPITHWLTIKTVEIEEISLEPMTLIREKR